MSGINQISSNTSLLELLLEQRIKNRTSSNTKKSTSLDTVSISNEARQLANTCKSSGSSVNTNLDNSIDLQSYIDEANEKNQQSIENAGESIKTNNSYTSKSKAYRAALNDKYTKLVATAKQHSNPTDYIYQKYYDQSCSWYESDLSDNERQIAYNYEMDVLNTGKVCGVKMGDSLFRDLEESTVSSTDLELTYNRDMINSQIGNILESNNITIPSDSTITYSVDPYSYYISASGADSTLQAEIEQALNTGENGKNLYYHIRNCSIQDGANSTQTSKMGYEKYQLYHQVEDLTGIDISTLTERDGSYYTADNENILDIVNQKIGESEEIPISHKSDMRQWIAQMVSDIAKIGWDNISDMPLQIDYSNGKLQDKYQEITYGSN